MKDATNTLPSNPSLSDAPGFFSVWGKGGWTIYFGKTFQECTLIGKTDQQDIERLLMKACQIGYQEGAKTVPLAT